MTFLTVKVWTESISPTPMATIAANSMVLRPATQLAPELILGLNGAQSQPLLGSHGKLVVRIPPGPTSLPRGPQGSTFLVEFHRRLEAGAGLTPPLGNAPWCGSWRPCRWAGGSSWRVREAVITPLSRLVCLRNCWPVMFRIFRSHAIDGEPADEITGDVIQASGAELADDTAFGTAGRRETGAARSLLTPAVGGHLERPHPAIFTVVLTSAHAGRAQPTRASRVSPGSPPRSGAPQNGPIPRRARRACRRLRSTRPRHGHGPAGRARR